MTRRIMHCSHRDYVMVQVRLYFTEVVVNKQNNLLHHELGELLLYNKF